MTLYVPPSDQPNASDVKTNTSNEAVTSGEFWKVTAQVQNGGAFYIDDEIALDSIGTATYVYASSSSIGSTDVISAVGYDRKLSWYHSVAASSTYTVGIKYSSGGKSNFISAAGTNNGDLFLPANCVVNVQYTSTGSTLYLAISASTLSVDYKCESFIVPAGTNLKVAGDAHYHIAKYKNIGS